MHGRSELPVGDALRALGTAGARMPEPINAILEGFATQASAVSASAIRELLGRQIAAEVATPCATSLAGRFPLSPSSADEIPRETFVRAFAPGGLFDGFFQHHLVSFVDTAASPWRFRPVDGQPAREALPALATFRQAQAIRDAFFRDGRGTFGMQIDLTLVDLDRGLKE